ncbi:YggS family pyridoxal phosphate-dependent enzyme [Marinobacter changyiensis]|uniref:YggS family pyridoxal phosphate-dependent enzyme n=1 Tax=Marinobacter changyiensis TaxID=2604091 RepID=UPI0012643CE4|nr:YggS family pyridoxal phosphate-dependent enzyme [Marinobacter changyiensis]
MAISIADNLGSVTRRIQKATMAAGREPGAVRLLAVSKTRSSDDIRAAVSEGVHAFGENYLQEVLDKMAELQDVPELEWHFIGPIQSNKTRAIAEHFDWVHSVDRLKIAKRLSDQRPDTLPALNICIQVNVDGEASKAGCAPDELPELARQLATLPRLCLRGLMAIPDPDQSDAQLQHSFKTLAEALKAMRADLPQAEALDTLSMGMSGDLELAIKEGATWVRIGTALFGERPAKS